MKIIILITVIESLAIMSAIMYFYYRRSQKTRGDFQMALHCRSEEQTVKAKLQNQKSGPATLGSIHSPLKEGYKE
jgi:hypothetical protein